MTMKLTTNELQAIRRIDRKIRGIPLESLDLQLTMFVLHLAPLIRRLDSDGFGVPVSDPILSQLKGKDHLQSV